GAAVEERPDLVERHREHVVQDECEPLGRSERLEHDVEGEADAVGDQSLVLGARTIVQRHDRLRHPRADEVLAARAAGAEHVEADAAHDRRQPRTEVLDGRLVGAAEPDPRFLHGVVGLVDRAEHAVGDPPQLRPFVLEACCQPVPIGHLTRYDGRGAVDVTTANCHTSRPRSVVQSKTDRSRRHQLLTTVQTPSFLATRRGKLTLLLLCGIAFLDFVDGSITNVALPSIRRSLHFSVEGLQWIPSGYLLTYGGFMLLGGRLADLLGRRRLLASGIVLIGVSSLVGGFAQTSGVLVGARLAQGLGAALTLPAALSVLTTTFKEGKDRNTALGAWGGTGGLASAAGVLLGGLLVEGPGWRWVMFVNPIACALVLPAVFRLIEGERRRRIASFDALGALLVTGGMLLLVYALVKAPIVGWGTARTIGELAAA